MPPFPGAPGMPMLPRPQGFRAHTTNHSYATNDRFTDDSYNGYDSYNDNSNDDDTTTTTTTTNNNNDNNNAAQALGGEVLPAESGAPLEPLFS